MLLSARTATALAGQAARLRDQLRAHPEAELPELAHSLATGRTQLAERAVLVAADRAELLSALEQVAAGEEPPVRGTAGDPGGVVFVFPGQGSQWAGMALDLYHHEPVFHQALDACATALAHTTWNLTQALTTPKAWTHAHIVQPALWAVMISLATLWQHHGITPHAVIGHSQGEIAAAHIAGALTLEDSARIIALRAQAITTITGHGAMASIALPAARITGRWGDRITVAVTNAEDATVVAGDPGTIAEVVAAYTAEDVRAKVLPVDYASHSPYVEPLREPILAALGGITPQESRIPFYSTVTAEEFDTRGLTAEYWFTNLRSPVRFDRAVARLRERATAPSSRSARIRC